MATLQEMRSESRPYHTDVRWFHSETVTDATSEPLVLPALDRDTVAVTVVPGTDATLQITTSSYSDIEGDAAIWADWEDGAVTAATSRSVDARVTALRLVSTGASAWEVTA